MSNFIFRMLAISPCESELRLTKTLQFIAAALIIICWSIDTTAEEYPESQPGDDYVAPSPDITTFEPAWIGQVSKYVNFNTSDLGAFGWTGRELRDANLAVSADGSVYLLCNTYQKIGDYINRDILLVKYNAQYEREWYKQIGTDRVYDNGAGIAVDPQGNIYITGSLTLVGKDKYGYSCAFVQSYTPTGKQRWAFVEKGFRNDCSSGFYDIALSEDSIYLTGKVHGQLNRSRSHRKTDGDLLVTRLKLNGQKIWSKQYQAASESQSLAGYGIAYRDKDQIYIVGQRIEKTRGPIPRHHSGKDEDGFLIRIDNDGHKKWTQTIGVNPDPKDKWERGANEIAFGIKLDAHGQIYVAGNSDASLDTFRHDPELHHTMPFLAKYSSDGKQQWLRQYTWSWQGVEAKNMAISQDDRIFVVGRAKSPSMSFFIIEYNTDGHAVGQLYPSDGVPARDGQEAYYPFRGDAIALTTNQQPLRFLVTGEAVNSLVGPVDKQHYFYYLTQIPDFGNPPQDQTENDPTIGNP